MNRNFFRRTIGFLVLGIGFLISYLILNAAFFNFEIVKQVETTSSDVQNKQGSPSTAFRSIGDGLLEKMNNPVVYNASNSVFSSISSSVDRNNLTDNFIGRLSEEIKPLAVSLKGRGGDKSVDVNNLTSNLVKNFNFRSLPALELVSDIPDSELKVTSDTSRQAKLRYLKMTLEINKKDFGNFNKNYLQIIVDVFKNLDSSSAARLATIYRNLSQDYLNVEVPRDWVSLHKALIMHFRNSEIIYSALANYQNDPLKGYLALELVENVSVDNFNEVWSLLESKLKESNFNYR
jgi:hypothetical protein